MNSPRFAGLAAKLLARAATTAAPPRQVDRERAIAAIEQALLQKARRRRRARWATGAVAVLAAAAAIGLFVRSHRSSPPVPSSAVVAIGQPTGSGARLLTSAGSEPLRNGSPLPPGGRLVADAHGGAALRLSTGTEIAIEHDASLAFSDAGPTEHFVLSQGSIRAHVAKLAPGERFIVSTPDAEVEVHGTVFSVGFAESDGSCDATSRTRVAVSEGVVEVRSGGQSSFVHPGESWPASCRPTVAAAAQREESSQPERRAVASSGNMVPEARPRGQLGTSSVVDSASSASRLAEQNGLFAQGMAARRAGDSARAVAAFDALLSRYPASALAESATAERLRVLASVNASAARRAAKEYLARYAQGFARPDAEAILAAP